MGMYLPRTSSSIIMPTAVDIVSIKTCSGVELLVFSVAVNVSSPSCIESSVMLTDTDTHVSPGGNVTVSAVAV